MSDPSVLEYPVYVRMPTEENQPYFANKSGAEAVINALIDAQSKGWLRLHGFVVLPDAVAMVMSPIKQGVAGVVAHIQSETTPVLNVLLPKATYVWARHYSHTPIKSAPALDARLKILLLEPVAQDISASAELYPYSSANPRYTANVSAYGGFDAPVIKPKPSPALALATADPKAVTGALNGEAATGNKPTTDTPVDSPPPAPQTPPAETQG